MLISYAIKLNELVPGCVPLIYLHVTAPYQTVDTVFPTPCCFVIYGLQPAAAALRQPSMS